jgi:hypothetical protein
MLKMMLLTECNLTLLNSSFFPCCMLVAIVAEPIMLRGSRVDCHVVLSSMTFWSLFHLSPWMHTFFCSYTGLLSDKAPLPRISWSIITCVLFPHSHYRFSRFSFSLPCILVLEGFLPLCCTTFSFYTMGSTPKSTRCDSLPPKIFPNLDFFSELANAHSTCSVTPLGFQIHGKFN